MVNGDTTVNDNDNSIRKYEGETKKNVIIECFVEGELFPVESFAIQKVLQFKWA